MDKRKRQLLKTAAKLYSVGQRVDAARQRLKYLVSSGAPYESKEMLAALEEFKKWDGEWKRLEKEYERLRQEL